MISVIIIIFVVQMCFMTLSPYFNARRILIGPACWLLLLAGEAAGREAQDALRVQALVQQWVSLEQQADALEQAWQQQKVVLEQRQELLEIERRSLKLQVARQSENQSNDQDYRAELLAQQNQYERNQQQVLLTLDRTLQRIQAIEAQLPEPLAHHWQQRRAELSSDTVSARLDLQLALLKSLDDFQGRITQHQTTMVLAGQEVLVDQFYLGIAKGWYVSRDGQFAGTGSAGDGQWNWRASNDLAPQLSAIVEVLNQPESAQLLPLPVNMLKADAP